MLMKNFLLNDLNNLAQTTTKSFFEVPKTVNDIWFDNLKMFMKGTNFAEIYKDNNKKDDINNDFCIAYAKEKVRNLNLSDDFEILKCEFKKLENDLSWKKVEVLKLTRQNEELRKIECNLNANLEKERLINNNLSTQFGVLECELTSVKKEWKDTEQNMLEKESNLRKKIKEMSGNNSALNMEIDNLKSGLEKSEKLLSKKSTSAKNKKANTVTKKVTVAAATIKDTGKELIDADVAESKSVSKDTSRNNTMKVLDRNKDITVDNSPIINDAFSKLNNVTILPLREDTSK